ncbi:MAG: hypothetical protein ABJC26_13265 [Gemmatimonadaceae bacterium]
MSRSLVAPTIQTFMHENDFSFHHRLRLSAVAALLSLSALIGACSSYGPTDLSSRGGYPPGDSTTRVFSSIALTIALDSIEVGQTTFAISIPRDQFGFAIVAGAPLFGCITPNIATVNGQDGRVLGVSPGIATVTVTIGAVSAQKTVKVVAAPIRSNALQSRGRS